MKRTNQIRLAAIAAVLCVGFLIASLSTRMEPEHNGKSLSEWLAMGGESEEARVAIQAIGEDAIPFLVERLGRRTSRTTYLKQRLWLFSQKLGIDYPIPHQSRNFFTEATTGFNALGKVGISTLLELLNDDNANVRRDAFRCLVNLVDLIDNPVEVYEEVLLNEPMQGMRSGSAEILGNIGSTQRL